MLRACPSCGKRFRVRLVAKELVEDDLRVVTVDRGRVQSPGMGGFGARAADGPLVVGEDIPLTVDVKGYRYTYRCNHCGNSWAEEHEGDVGV